MCGVGMAVNTSAGVCEKRVWPYGLPRIRSLVYKLENVEQLTAALRGPKRVALDTEGNTYESLTAPQLTREEKVQLWRDLQTCSFARALGSIFGLAAYTCYSSLQHALIGRYLFIASSLEPSATAGAARLPKLAMERFLCASEHFLGPAPTPTSGSSQEQGSPGEESLSEEMQASGLFQLMQIVHKAVEKSFSGVSLADPMPPTSFIERLTKACVLTCAELHQVGYSKILQGETTHVSRKSLWLQEMKSSSISIVSCSPKLTAPLCRYWYGRRIDEGVRRRPSKSTRKAVDLQGNSSGSANPYGGELRASC